MPDKAFIEVSWEQCPLCGYWNLLVVKLRITGAASCYTPECQYWSTGGEGIQDKLKSIGVNTYQCGLCDVVGDAGPNGEPPPGWELSEQDTLEPELPRYWMCNRCQREADTDGSSVEGEETEEE